VFLRKDLSQHVLKDAAMQEVLDFHIGVQSEQSLECYLSAVFFGRNNFNLLVHLSKEVVELNFYFELFPRQVNGVFLKSCQFQRVS
jgi:hypothetical protein